MNRMKRAALLLAAGTLAAIIAVLLPFCCEGALGGRAITCSVVCVGGVSGGAGMLAVDLSGR